MPKNADGYRPLPQVGPLKHVGNLPSLIHFRAQGRAERMSRLRRMAEQNRSFAKTARRAVEQMEDHSTELLAYLQFCEFEAQGKEVTHAVLVGEEDTACGQEIDGHGETEADSSPTTRVLSDVDCPLCLIRSSVRDSLRADETERHG